MKLEYIVNEEDEGKNLKTVLKKKLYISNILLIKLKKAKSIYVNNKEVFVTYILKKKDKIVVDLEKMYNVLENETVKFSDKYKLNDAPLDILYEDEYILVVNKPCFLPSHPSASSYENTLANRVASYLQEQGIYTIHIVTRLDKDTSGVCIFAKNEYIQELFVRKKSAINLKKEYLAIVYGIVHENHGIIEDKIARDKNSIITRTVSETGDYAKTEFWTLNRNYALNYTTLKILLHTGRTHQIRVHFSHQGHVLLGDELYAKALGFSDDVRKLISRQALHAKKISLNHPITDSHLEIEAPIPDDIKKLISKEASF